MGNVRGRLIVLGAVTFAGLFGTVLGAPALAKQHNRVKLTAPATSIAGEAVAIHVSGFVVAPANLLTYYLSTSGCPAAFHIPDSVGNQPGSLQLHPGKRGKHFSFTIGPAETTPGLYHICAYLIHGHKTYARATGQTDTAAL